MSKLKDFMHLLPFYFFFQMLSFLLIIIIWSGYVDGHLYYCSDKVPILDFIPPFMHGSLYGDYYIAPAGLVYALWVLLLIVLVSLPFMLLKLLLKEQSSLLLTARKQKIPL